MWGQPPRLSRRAKRGVWCLASSHDSGSDHCRGGFLAFVLLSPCARKWLGLRSQNGTTMTKYSVLTAVLLGIGFAALVVLLLNIPDVNLVATMLLLPGGFATSPFTRGEGWNYAIALLAANAFIYSSLFLLFVRHVNGAVLNRASARLSIPVLILSCLGCLPRLNPLWPHALNTLTRQEVELQSAIPLGITLPQARVVLSSRRINFQEEAEDSQKSVLSNRDAVMNAMAGDQVLVSRIQTEAHQFPCGYDLQIVLLFGRDDKLKERYIHRLRICP
jgi:hypothetical protein